MGLQDFRIENDSVVFLHFSNGQSYRVSPKELERYLTASDLTKVREAIRLRRQFMRRILPPTLLLGLVVGIAGLGSYDAQRLALLLRHTTPTVCSASPSLAGIYGPIGLSDQPLPVSAGVTQLPVAQAPAVVTPAAAGATAALAQAAGGSGTDVATLPAASAGLSVALPATDVGTSGILKSTTELAAPGRGAAAKPASSSKTTKLKVKQPVSSTLSKLLSNLLKDHK